MVLNKRFQVRSPERDLQIDIVRLDSVRTAINTARSQAIRESEGLQRRIQGHYQSAVAVLDHSGEYDERSTEDELTITAEEGRAVAGQRRLEAVKTQIAAFDDLLMRLNALQAGRAPT